MTSILESHCANLEKAIEDLLIEYDLIPINRFYEMSDNFHLAIKRLRQSRIGIYKQDKDEIYRDSFVEL